MNKIQITKMEKQRCRSGFVWVFEHWNFDIVSDFGFRYSNFHAILNCQNQGQDLWDGVLVWNAELGLRIAEWKGYKP